MKSSVFDLQVNGITMGVHSWLPDDGKVVAILQVSHGMAEHGARYARLAQEFTERGWAVYAGDHRGHGRTAGSGPMGHFADHGGWDLAVEDLRTVALHTMSQHPGVPHVLLGHSMGSLLARDYAARYGNDLAALVLIGSPSAQGLIGKVGKLMAKNYVRVRGPRTPAQRLHKMTFGSYNHAFKPNRTEYDWLSRDEAMVDAYVADPLCGFVCTNAFYVDIITGVEKTYSARTIKQMPRKLPVWVASGAVDPAGGHRTVKAVKQLLRGNGIKDVTALTYDGARHEILNETNRDEVLSDLFGWLAKHDLPGE